MGPSDVVTKNCCFCWTLRTGTLIILWLYLLGGISWMVSPTISGEYKTTSTVEVAGNSTDSFVKYGSNLKKSSLEDIFTPYAGFGWFICVIGALDVVTSIFGLYAIYTDNHPYLKPCLVWSAIDLLIVTIGFIRYWFTAHFNVIAIFYLCLECYCWIVVYSQYRDMKDQVSGGVA